MPVDIETLSKRRSTMMMLFAVSNLLLLLSLLEILQPFKRPGYDWVEALTMLGFVGMGVSHVAIFRFRKKIRRDKSLAAVLTDELVKHNRSRAIIVSYASVIAAAFLLFMSNLLHKFGWSPSVSGQDTALIIVMTGNFIFMAAFAFLERRNA